MTPQFIMKAAGRAHVAKHVPQPDCKWDSKEQVERSMLSEIENMDWAKEYAEPGYSQPAKGILFANWNYFDRRITSILDTYGFECEWSDEWSTCENCNRAIRTSPDSYEWTPSYVILHDCEIVCNRCLLDDESSMREYLEGLEDSPNNALNLHGVNPAKYGYREVEAGFESGFHPGQNDRPSAITDRLRDAGVNTPLLFKIDDKGQFDIRFSVWTRDIETDMEETEQ